jgi:predicted phage replisome organizer/uncharacterized phage protein (TIGR02220 family)
VPEVKWIKLNTHMFEDEKIKLIEQMPEADTILVIWIKLLSQAGKTNASGYIFLSENIPYTDEMLAAIFNRPLMTVRLALKTFQQFGMIDISENDFISISNWEKHQNIEGLEKIREQNRIRKQKQREKQLLIESRDSHETVTQSHATDIEIELELDKEKIEIIPYVEIVSYLNEKSSSSYKSSTKKTKDLIKARWNEGFKLDDFKTVIDKKVDEWTGTKYETYLRPETLFGTKFESYLNQKGVKTNGKPEESYLHNLF